MSSAKIDALCKLFVIKQDRVGTRAVVVSFDDWSANDTGEFLKGCPGSPVKRFRHALKRHCTVVDIDEFQTSKMHHGCASSDTGDLENMRQKSVCIDGKEREVKFYPELHRKRKNGGCCTTVNRDVNASRKIQQLLRLQQQSIMTRPPALARGRPSPAAAAAGSTDS